MQSPHGGLPNAIAPGLARPLPRTGPVKLAFGPTPHCHAGQLSRPESVQHGSYMHRMGCWGSLCCTGQACHLQLAALWQHHHRLPQISQT